MKTDQGRPKCIPADVPWRVDTSGGIASFFGSEGSVTLRFLGFFGEHVAQRDQERIEATGRQPTDEELNFFGHRQIQLDFPSIVTFRMTPPFSDCALLDTLEFDWSKMPLNDIPLSAFSRRQREHAVLWSTSGRCPDPRFYSIEESPLIRELCLTKPSYQHMVILGHDCYFEIVAEKYEWSEV